MSTVHEKANLLNEISCDEPITKITISDDDIMYVNPESEWEIDKIFTDYKTGDHKELIVIFKHKEINE